MSHGGVVESGLATDKVWKWTKVWNHYFPASNKKKIRPFLYSKYPPYRSKYGLIIDAGHREGCHLELYIQN